MTMFPDIVKWIQTGHQDKDESGHLVFTDKNESVVLKLDLHKKDGLYYSWIDSYVTDHNPIRVHTVHGPQSTTLPPFMTHTYTRLGPPHISSKTQMTMMTVSCNQMKSPLTQTAPACWT